jgi:hypothetical protein
VITHVARQDDGSLLVRGTVIDNGDVRRVVVNGQDAALDSAAGTWEAKLPATASSHGTVSAHSEDAAGNVEQLVHSWAW